MSPLLKHLVFLLLASAANAQPTPSEIADAIEQWRARIPTVPLLAVDELGEGNETWFSGRDTSPNIATSRRGRYLLERGISIQNPRYHANVVMFEVTEGAEKPDDWPTDEQWPPQKTAQLDHLQKDAEFVPPFNFAADFVSTIDGKTPWATILRQRSSVKDWRPTDGQVEATIVYNGQTIQVSFDGARGWLPYRIQRGQTESELTGWQNIAADTPLYTAARESHNGSDKYMTLAWHDLPRHSKKECYLTYYGLPEPDRPVNYAWWIGLAGVALLALLILSQLFRKG